MSDLQTPKPIHESERFAPRTERRDFLGMAALGSFLGTGLVMVAGALRLPMPSVFPETGTKFRIGPPERFPVGSGTPIQGRNVLILRDEAGIRALSLVCTHLGCITQPTEEGFVCPCHGSRFGVDGRVTAGPAPSALRYLEVSRAPSGDLVVDGEKVVGPEARYAV